MNKFLLYLRRAVAGIVGLWAVALFALIPISATYWSGVIFDLQIVPAILSGAIITLCVIFAVTLIFGRIYCSMLCPLGILQDFILRIKKWTFSLRGKKKKFLFHYKKPLNIIRYSVLAVVIIGLVLGSAIPLGLLDPYSIFGRIVSSLFSPIVIWSNNIVATLLAKADNYWLHLIPMVNTNGIVIAVSATIVVVLTILVWLRGRIWCNTMCPVGTLLGLISKFSLFRISPKEGCNSCGLCGFSCKAECIDSKSGTVDASRCVMCFNCLSHCKNGALTYAPTGWCKNKNIEKTADSEYQSYENRSTPEIPTTSSETNNETQIDSGRRAFIKGLATISVMAPLSIAYAQCGKGHGRHSHHNSKLTLPMPPGVGSRERFFSKCTGCQLCVSQCPTQVLKPALMENGLRGVMQPYMDFRVEHFCNYECNVCSQVCPNDAIMPLTLEQKKLTRIGIAEFHHCRCIVFKENQDCGACAEHCPTQAVHMIPYKNGLTIPSVNPDLCIGCGGCQSICPATPIAIVVNGIDVQNRALPPTRDILDTEEVTDFGF